MRKAAEEAAKTQPADQAQEYQAQAEILLNQAIPDLPLDLITGTLPANEVAMKLREKMPNEEDVYLLWLKLPDGACYCHFSWDWNEKAKRTTFRIRDYLHGKLYYCVTPSVASEVRSGKWDVVDWNHHKAIDVWGSARRRVRCRGALAVNRTKMGIWKTTLEEMTRSLAPGEEIAVE